MLAAKAVALASATSATRAPTALRAPTAMAAAQMLSLAPAWPEVLVAFAPPAEVAILAVANPQMMEPLASTIPAAKAFPAGHPPPPDPAPYRLAEGRCSQ